VDGEAGRTKGRTGGKRCDTRHASWRRSCRRGLQRRGGNARPDADADQDVDTGADTAPDVPADGSGRSPAAASERCGRDRRGRPTRSSTRSTRTTGASTDSTAPEGRRGRRRGRLAGHSPVPEPPACRRRAAGLRLLMNRPGERTDGRSSTRPRDRELPLGGRNGHPLRRPGELRRLQQRRARGRGDGPVARPHRADTGDATEVLLGDGTGTHVGRAMPACRRAADERHRHAGPGPRRGARHLLRLLVPAAAVQLELRSASATLSRRRAGAFTDVTRDVASS